MNKTGFGFLRLPRIDASDKKSVDYCLLNAMVDRFLELGGRYFDTAYTYLGGVSEEALRKSLVERYPREAFLLADKLPGYMIKSYEECQKYFTDSLQRCGVDYFDVYLLHWLNANNYELAEKYDEFRFLQECKRNGTARKIGFSYHDSPELLDRILNNHPELDYVQLQINYLDWDSITLQSRQCYEVAVRHGKQIIVMEPVKGGNLANLPEEATAMLKTYRPEDSIASWAIRFASSLPDVEIVLSGMNTMQQMEDNMRCFLPVSEEETTVLYHVAEIIRSKTAVSCTGCSYCTACCPIGMPIPQYFAIYNDYARNPSENWKMQFAYDAMTKANPKASECIGCRQCETNCPQKIGITSYLEKMSKVFDINK